MRWRPGVWILVAALLAWAASCAPASAPPPPTAAPAPKAAKAPQATAPAKTEPKPAPSKAEGAPAKPLGVEGIANLPPGPDRQRILEEGARREGQLVMYTTATGLEGVAQAFMQDYPYIKMEIFASRGEPLTQRTLAEHRAGQMGGDILRIDFGVYIDLKDVAVDKFSSPGARFDRVPNMASLDYSGIGFTYSSQRTAQADLPQRVEDLLLPRWRENIGLFAPPNNFPGRWVGMLFEHMGEAGARDYLRRLGDQRPYFYTAPEQAKNGLLSGEWDISMQGITNAVTTSRTDEPVRWVALDPTTLSPTVIGLMKLAPHPHAGMLFLDWAVSARGIKVFTDVQGSITEEELQRREKEGVRLPARITIQSPEDGQRLGPWMALFDELVVRK